VIVGTRLVRAAGEAFGAGLPRAALANTPAGSTLPAPRPRAPDPAAAVESVVSELAAGLTLAR
jgi:hypothetical protein